MRANIFFNPINLNVVIFLNLNYAAFRNFTCFTEFIDNLTDQLLVLIVKNYYYLL